MAEDFWRLAGVVYDGGGKVSSNRSRSAAFSVGGSEKERTGLFEDFLKGGVVWNANADGRKMIVVVMAEVWVFRKNYR